MSLQFFVLAKSSLRLKMKKFNLHKVLDGLTSSPGGSSSGTSGGSGTGGGSVHSGGTVGTPREEIQETLTSDYFQICKVSVEFLK